MTLSCCLGNGQALFSTLHHHHFTHGRLPGVRGGAHPAVPQEPRGHPGGAGGGGGGAAGGGGGWGASGGGGWGAGGDGGNGGGGAVVAAAGGGGAVGGYGVPPG